MQKDTASPFVETTLFHLVPKTAGGRPDVNALIIQALDCSNPSCA